MATKKPKIPRKRKSTKEGAAAQPTLSESLLDVLATTPQPLPLMRSVNLFGNRDDEQMQDVCQGLLYLKHVSDSEDIKHAKPIDFYISTWGGDALGMFAIYDLMRMMREGCPIHTFGFGKVMSAGVLLLAAGTKGQRKIGKNTRVMVHSVRGSHYGNIHSLQNEMDETRWIQDQLLDALVEETNLTKTKLNNMLNKKVDVYLSAEDAVKMGIADIII